MALTVVWMRHGKSSWDQQVTDERRELAPRGRANATAAGALLVSRGLAFDVVILSPAERARQTWENVSEAGVTAEEVREEVDLYGGDAETIVRLVADTDARTVLVIGHAPSIGEAVELCAARESTKPWAAFDIKYPTAALATVEAASGEDLVAGKGRLVDFVVPR
ncbi:MAG TPA: histidine phosphatase family protein [Propionibacteriaceae bacterium]|nr:histidine phosphatase family protein [Propionibacteriaceae bacterium]